MTQSARAELQALLGRLANGERGAVEPAFDALWPLLRRFSARTLSSEADAEDAAQRALMKIYEQAAEFDSSRDGLAWALTIVSFECRNLRLRNLRRREQDLASVIDAPSVVPTPETVVIDQDLQAAVREVLGTLSAEDGETLLAAMSDERPRGAKFRKRLQRALGRLRLAWRTKHGTQ